MIKEIELTVQPGLLNNYDYLREQSSKKLKLDLKDISSVRVIKRSIDARKRPVFRLKLEVFINESPREEKPKFNFNPVKSNKSVIIVGSGPAGLFAALRAIELGIKPIILERGKNVRDRRFDLKAIMQDGVVDADSNYCFGEGGAGTYSDGKLYTSNKRGNVNRIIDILIYHGANEEIRIDAHPHIGSNKLPKIIEAIRETIIKCNGQIQFEKKVTDFIINNNKISGVIVNSSEEIIGNSVVLATGHSARDIYEIFRKRELAIDAKPFAMGVRIEHPQALIDSIQYSTKIRHENLPASNYNLNCQVNDKGVYSFCMCPGGIIIPASTDSDELVLNGMSVSRRDSPFANSGLVVEVNQNDWKHLKNHGKFAGLEYQKEMEKMAFDAGGGKQVAPAQRITDFVYKRMSKTLPENSYVPGSISAPLHDLLPIEISKRLRKALEIFNKRMKGYFTDEAQILAIESRTSSPLRIPRDKETLMHTEIEGLFPSGEGAGYAGGIMSAAIDGERCAEQVLNYINK